MFRHVLLSAALLTLAPISAAAEDVEPYPIPGDANNIDLTGVWYHRSFNHMVEGRCPLGPHIAGTMTVSTTGEAVDSGYSITLTGGECRPAGVCQFAGDIINGGLYAANDLVVDDEGGRVSSGFYVTFFARDFGVGWYQAVYTLDDFTCSWTHSFSVRRDDPWED